MDEDERGGDSSPEISFLIFDDNKDSPQNDRDTQLAQKFWKQFELEPQIESNLVATDKISQSSRHNSFISRDKKIRSMPMRYSHKSSGAETDCHSLRSSQFKVGAQDSERGMSSSNTRPRSHSRDVFLTGFEDSLVNYGQTPGGSSVPQENQSSSGFWSPTRRGRSRQQHQRNNYSSSKRSDLRSPNSFKNQQQGPDISDMVRQLKATNLRLANNKQVLGNIRKKGPGTSGPGPVGIDTSQNNNNTGIDPNNSRKIQFEENSSANHANVNGNLGSLMFQEDDLDIELDNEEIEREMAQLDLFDKKQGLRA